MIFKKITAVVLSAVLVGSFSAVEYYSAKLPDSFTAECTETFEIAEYPDISCSALNDSNYASLSLFGTIPLKNVEITEKEAPVLAVGGVPFGIKLLMEGVMVTGLGEVHSKDGSSSCPADESGVKKGDIITLVNGIPVSSNAELQSIVNSCSGDVVLTVKRSELTFDIPISPVISGVSDSRKCGMWIRDSIAGIGTITFIDTSTGKFGGLGHPICDADTGELVPIHSGEAVPVKLTEAKKGSAGIPGEVHGKFTPSESYGTLKINNETGIYGELSQEGLEKLCRNAEKFPLGYRQDITEGEAYIYTSVYGDTPDKYSAVIESVDISGENETKNMVIRITDERLIEKTGGIIQGMSGSPIIQNGKIIGAVTHVFVADPTKGYGIFAENMVKYIDDE